MNNLALSIKRWRYGYKKLSMKALKKAYKKRSLLAKVGVLLMVFGLVSNMASLPLIYAAGDTAARLVGEGADGSGTKILKVYNGSDWEDEISGIKPGATVNLRALAYNDAHEDVIAKDIMAKFNAGGEGNTELNPSINFNSVNAGIVNGYTRIGIDNTDQNKKYKLVVNKVVVRELKQDDEVPEKTLTQADVAQLLGSGLNIGDLNGGQPFNKRIFINGTIEETTVTNQAELAVTLTSDKSKIQPSDDVTYTVKVKNTKELEAVNVRIASTLKTATYANPNTAIIGHTYQNNSLKFAANSQKFALSQIAISNDSIMIGLNNPLLGGETAEYSYTVKADKVAENAGMQNTTEAQAENSAMVQATNLVAIETAAQGTPKLNLLVVATPHFNIEGKASDHDIAVTLTNTGDAVATDVSLDIDHILGQANKGPGSATYKAGTLKLSNAQGVTFDANDPTKAIKIASLAAKNGSLAVTYTLSLDDKYIAGDKTTVKGVASETSNDQRVEAEATIETRSTSDTTQLEVSAKIVETNGTKVDKASRKPGEEVKIEATLTNKGQIDAANYRLSEIIDSRIQNVKADKTVPLNNTLKSQESITYTFTGTLDNSDQTFPAGTITNLTENYFKAHAANAQEVSSNKVTVEVSRADVAGAKLSIKAVILDGNNEVTKVTRKAGEEVKIKVTTTNTGSEVAKAYHVDPSIDAKIVSVKAQGVSASQMDLAPGATDTKLYTGTVKSDLTGSHTLVSNFKASAQNVAAVQSNDVIVEVGDAGNQGPALDLKQTVDKAKAEPGDELTYTITYKNNTGKVASDVVISDKLSAYVDYISTSAKNLKDAGNNTILFQIGTLQPGQGGEIIVKAKIKDNTPTRTIVTTTANATYKDPEGRDLKAGPASATTEVVGKTAGTTPGNNDGSKSGEVDPDREGGLKGVSSTPKTGASTFTMALFIATIGTLISFAGYVIYSKAKRLNSLKLDYVNFS